MNIKENQRAFSEVMAMKRMENKRPKKPNILFRTLLKVVSTPDLMATKFKCRKVGMEKLGKKEPCLILMNHSSFIDLKIASSVLYPRPFNIVATLDAFVGKEWLMRQLGCTPTRKFVFDIGLVRDIRHCIKKLGTSVLMYPEAGYSFDGTTTTLPDSLPKFIKMLGVPFVMLETFGAYHRDPLYNELQNRDVKVSAELRYVLSAEQVAQMSAEEIAEVVKREFSFDNFKWQQENGIKIDEKFRADGLERVLYKCPHCLAEGQMLGLGTYLTCGSCQKAWELTEFGFMKATDGDTEFDHIPNWYAWEREQIKAELDKDEYGFSEPVDIYMIVNSKGVFNVGDGTLTHSLEGFELTGCNGELNYSQKSISLYSLNSDFYWYKIGDVIGLGNQDAMYYCVPKERRHLVPKARLATEEIYKRISRKSAKE